METAMSSTLKLERESDGVAELRRKPFQIILDGAAARSIDRSQTVELPVAPGPHTIQVRMGRYSSHTHSFEAVDGTDVRFHCNGAIFWPRYLASLVVPTIGLKLQPE
jgi:hypothetical protein